MPPHDHRTVPRRLALSPGRAKSQVPRQPPPSFGRNDSKRRRGGPRCTAAPSTRRLGKRRPGSLVRRRCGTPVTHRFDAAGLAGEPERDRHAGAAGRGHEPPVRRMPPKHADSPAAAGMLVMELLPPGRATPEAAAEFGASLARMHAASTTRVQPAVVARDDSGASADRHDVIPSRSASMPIRVTVTEGGTVPVSA